MAEIIQGIVSRRDLYPWDKWANGKAWRAVHGTDFHTSVSGFCSSVYSHARRNGMAVHVSRDESGDRPVVEFRFEKPKRQR